MNKAIIQAVNGKLKVRLKIVLVLALNIIFIFIGSLLLADYLMQTMPDIELQTYFQETRLSWLSWRIALYGVIGVLLYHIHRYKPALSFKLGGLIMLFVVTIEGLALLYLI